MFFKRSSENTSHDPPPGHSLDAGDFPQVELPGEAVSYAAVAGGRSLPDFSSEPIEAAYRKASPKGAEHNERVAIAQDSVAWVYDTTADGSSVAHTTTRLAQASSGVWTVEPSS